MKLKLDLYKTSVKSSDKYLNIAEFNSRYVSTEPFFVWKNEEYGNLLAKLLSGQSVLLKADVKMSPANKDAIKFSLIELYFNSKNETTQSRINEILKGFDIIANHLGNSYYRYDNKIYLITSDSQSIFYSIEKNTAGEPVRKNWVYQKLKNGDLMLSLYTLWEIKMINSTSKISFRDLEVYKNKIDLELSGFGSYVTKQTSVFKSIDYDYRMFDEIDSSLQLNASQNNRLIQSLNYVDEIGSFTANSASQSLSSPINYVCNFIKMHIMSNLMISIHRIFVGKEKDMSQKTVLKIPNASELKNDMNQNQHEKTTIQEPTEKISNFLSFERNKVIGNDDKNKQHFADISGTSYERQGENLNPFLLGGKVDSQNSQLIQIPDVNYSLLFADLITRSITGNKYRYAVDESLLSPHEVVLKRINDGVVQNESDVKRYLMSFSTEKDDGKKMSWPSLAKSYVKSTFEFLGLVKNEVLEDYVQDIRILFNY
ncbi:uncharacterized protein CEXT_427171 [Caerostris extrusa]|uniref:Uncharacterized protein n=1 Tax=Caerostris extrusa TaxID=172846 RepID=A0AAV4R7V2_CAEEX|nr:uncharacterized protein CEXT_427171 [Caerostris extrusa]